MALSYTRFSHTGKLCAYAISASGSDWQTVYIRSADKPFTPASADDAAADAGPDRLQEKLEHIKFSVPAWTHDDKGLFYMRYPPPEQASKSAEFSKGTETDANQNGQLWYHRVGTEQSEDELIIDRDPHEPKAMFGPELSDDGKYLLVSSDKDTDPKNKLFIADISSQAIGPNMKWISIAGDWDYGLWYLANDDNRFYFMTNKDAQNSKIVYADIDFSQAKAVGHVTELKESLALTDLVPEEKDATLSGAVIVNQDKLLLKYTRDVKSELWQHELKTGKQVRRLLPDFVGTIVTIAGQRHHDEAFVDATSYVSPGSTFRFTWDKDAKADAAPHDRLWRATKVATIKPEDFVSEQVFFPSADGTRIPMFITRHKDTKVDGTAPAWLYAYGGFNIPISPSFSPWRMTWIAEYGGVLADVCARGGGEYGQKWHEAGRMFNKHKTFEDVLTAAKYLHENKYAQKGKIIIHGGSNGGMVVAASTNRATEEAGLGAAVAEVGVHDLLNFHRFTIGHAWTGDYGNPENPEHFDYIRTISPLHNVDPSKTYPTMLLSCADHDDRVVPAHTFKLAAELQHKLANSPNPILLRVDLKAGHGAGKSIQKRIEEIADRVAIIGQALGLKMRGSSGAAGRL